MRGPARPAHGEERSKWAPLRSGAGVFWRTGFLVAVHFATAYQIARELDLAGPEDAAAFLGGEDADA